MPLKALSVLPLTFWAFSACSLGTAPSRFLVGNWRDSVNKGVTLQMRLVGDARNVTGTACGTTAGYLSFRNVPVEVDGRSVRFVITKDSVISPGPPGTRFVGEWKADGTIVGRMTDSGLNFTLVRVRRGIWHL
jgi:hypothetical protein